MKGERQVQYWLFIMKIILSNSRCFSFCMKGSCEYKGKKKIMQNSKSFVISPCLVLWILEKTVCICIFHFYLTWFYNLPYLANCFLRTYCTHVLMLFEAPVREKSWLKAFSSTEVGGQRAGTEQLPSTHWTFVIYELFSMPSGARMVPWFRETLCGVHSYPVLI